MPRGVRRGQNKKITATGEETTSENQSVHGEDSVDSSVSDKQSNASQPNLKLKFSLRGVNDNVADQQQNVSVPPPNTNTPIKIEQPQQQPPPTPNTQEQIPPNTPGADNPLKIRIRLSASTSKIKNDDDMVVDQQYQQQTQPTQPIVDGNDKKSHAGSKKNHPGRKNVNASKQKSNYQDGEMEIEGDIDGDEDDTKAASSKSAPGKKTKRGETRKNNNKANSRSNVNTMTAVSSSAPSTTAPTESSSTAAAIPSDILQDNFTESLDAGDDGAYGEDDDDEEGGGTASKTGRKKRAKPKTRGMNKRAKPKNTIAEADLDAIFEEQDAHTAGYAAAAKLWKDVEAFYSDFTQDDLEFCTAKISTPERPLKDDCLTIPKLGVHYSVTMNEQGRVNPRARLTASVNEATGDMGGEGPITRADTMTSRILSALIDESGVVSVAEMFGDDELSQSVSEISEMMQDDIGMLQELESIDKRIRSELKAIDLLDDNTEMLDNVKEDDEICAELRKLQIQLKNQIDVNNRNKGKLYQRVLDQMEIQKEKKKEKDGYLAQEQSLVNQMKKFKKRKRPEDDDKDK